MKKNFIIILDGPMGAGKSTIGELLHKKLKRTALLNMDKIKWFISDYRRSKRDNRITNAVLFRMCEEYLNQGISLIIPQGFWQTRHIAPFQKLSKKFKANLFVYHLDAPTEILLERIGKRKYEKVTPPAKSRVVKNIRSWKVGRFVLGKEFNTHLLNPGDILREILRDLV
jgi:predicted kinase